MESVISSPDRVHVIPSGDKWAVKREGTAKASKLYLKKKAAVKGARSLARSRAGRVIVHGKDGTIQHQTKP